MSAALFIGDLSSCCSVQDIEKEFAKFGEIADIRIKTDPDTKKRLSYGFIEFYDEKSAGKALETLNGVILCGRAMRISWAASKTAIKSNEPVSNNRAGLKYLSGTTSASVHVKFTSYQPKATVTEETLRNLFCVYGTVTDVVIKKIETKLNSSSIRGYGFVHYSDTADGIISAMNAVNALGCMTLNNVDFTCTVSRHFATKLSEGSVGSAQGSPSSQSSEHVFQAQRGFAPSASIYHLQQQQYQQQFHHNNQQHQAVYPGAETHYGHSLYQEQMYPPQPHYAVPYAYMSVPPPQQMMMMQQQPQQQQLSMQMPTMQYYPVLNRPTSPHSVDAMAYGMHVAYGRSPEWQQYYTSPYHSPSCSPPGNSGMHYYHQQHQQQQMYSGVYRQ